MPEDMVPKAKVAELAANVRQLQDLHRKQQATQAELIRWCVRELRADTNTHRLRGHEDWHDKRRIIAENRENKAKALLYLEWLATQLEDQSVSDNLTTSTEGEDHVQRTVGVS